MTAPAGPSADSGQAAPAAEPALSLIMPTLDWGPTFEHCLRTAWQSLGCADQLLVVHDGPPSPPPAWVTANAITVLHTGVRSGPGAARNLAARQARSPILLFVDADVALHDDAVEKVRTRFRQDHDLVAVFGSYDASPAAPGLVSQFRNLLHHHTHVSHPGPVCTFWTGCGAVRRDHFLALGGFDPGAYRSGAGGCIEDIEFGLRVSDAGGRILLDPTIQCTHHKRWTLRSMVATDIHQRAIPWSRLLVSRRELPATLNISQASRISGVLSLLLAAALPALCIPPLWPWAPLTAAAAVAGLAWLNRSLLALLRRRGGLRLALAGTALLSLYFLYSTLCFAAVKVASLAAGTRRRQARVAAAGASQRWPD